MRPEVRNPKFMQGGMIHEKAIMQIGYLQAPAKTL